MSNTKNIVNVFVPCCMDLFVPASAQSMMSVLERLGDECLYVSELTCCGRQFYIRGDRDTASKLAYQLTSAFDNEYDIVVPSPACAGFIKNTYGDLTSMQSFPKAVGHITKRTFELCDYIVNEKKVTCLGNNFPHKVFYFQSCSERNSYRSGNEIITLLENTGGLKLFMDLSMNTCCSANGGSAFHNHELSEFLLKMIVDRALESEAEFITCSDVHCLQYIDAYLQQEGIDIETASIPQILNSFEEDNVDEEE